MKGFIKTYYPRFVEILKENGLQVNLLLLVALVTFVVMWVDLDSDLAVQKNEIDSVVATLTNSINTLSIDSSTILVIEPPFLGILASYEYKPTNTDILDFPKGRSPPLQNQISC